MPYIHPVQEWCEVGAYYQFAANDARNDKAPTGGALKTIVFTSKFWSG